MLKNRREVQESLLTDSLKENTELTIASVGSLHSNHLREQRGKFSNLAEGVSALAVQQNHFGKIHIYMVKPSPNY